MGGDALTQRTLALWEAELHKREEKLKDAGFKGGHLPTCECGTVHSVKEVLAEVMKLRRDEKESINTLRRTEIRFMQEMEAVQRREERVRLAEEQLREREAVISRREEAALRRELELHKREMEALHRAYPERPRPQKRTTLPKIDVGNIPASHQDNAIPADNDTKGNWKGNASPKYRQGPTNEDPDNVESYVENISDSEQGSSVQGGIITSEGVVGMERWRELFRAATASPSDDGEGESLSRKETWRRRLSTVSKASALSDDEFDAVYEESEGLSMQEALLQYILNHDPSCLPPGIDPDVVVDMLMSTAY